jgi:hypothetical protein
MNAPDKDPPSPPDFTGVPLTLDHWAKREIQPKDFLLGEVFSTTTRAILSADTGLGKTHLGFALAFAMAAGVNFCHWEARRAARILLIDGEMSADLVQERLADAERRLGVRPDALFVLCKEDVEDMPPLDAMDGDGNMIGQYYVEYLVGHLGGIDFIIFDNLGSLTIGNLADPESWLPVVPWTRSLTKQRIGQLWVNHTGHDKTRDYGPRARLWQMDTAMLAQKIEGSDADIAFKLEFVKSRQRKPSNRADYETVDMILHDDQWSTTASATTKTKRRGKNQQVLLDCLDTVIAETGKPSPKFTGMPTTGLVTDYGIWERQCLAQLGQGTERRRKQAFEEAA